MEIRIGIANTGREPNFEPATCCRGQDRGRALDAAPSTPSFSDAKGRSYIVPTASLADIELGTEESRRVGFVA